MANASNRQHVQNAAAAEKAERRAELDGVRYLMADARGRALVKRLLDLTGADRKIPFQPNAMMMAHDIATVNLGHWLLDEIRVACPEKELDMRREFLTRETRAQLTEEAQHDNDE